MTSSAVTSSSVSARRWAGGIALAWIGVNAVFLALLRRPAVSATLSLLLFSLLVILILLFRPEGLLPRRLRQYTGRARPQGAS